MTVSSIPSLSLPGERVPLPEGLTRLSDGALRVDGVDGTAVINPATGSESGGVSVETGLRVLQALGGTYLPTVGPAASAASTAPSPGTAGTSQVAAPGRSDPRSTASGSIGIVPAEPGDETTLLKPIVPVVPSSPAAPSPQEAAPQSQDPMGTPSPVGVDSPGEADSAAESAPELLETGIWEDPDESLEPPEQRSADATAEGPDAGGMGAFPDYPEPEPGSGRRRRGAHRAPTAPSASSGGRPTANTPTAPDNSRSKQPQPVRAPQPLEALPNTEVVSASEAALIAAPPVRASICPQGHANPPEIRECLICRQPLTGVFSYVRRPALATLTLSTGAAVEVAGDVVIGRAPQVQAGGDPHIVALVAVPSPQHMVSRSHLMLTTSGWSILAQDLGSSNGTVLARPGATPVLLGSGMPTPVFMGDLMDLGDGVTLRIDPPSWLRFRSG